MNDKVTSTKAASIAGRVLGGESFTLDDVETLAASCLAQYKGEQVAGHKGLPVAGYKPTQPPEAIAAVNVFKELEERTLRQIEVLLGERAAGGEYRYYPGCDARMLAVGRTQLQLVFMALNLAIFRPGRVALPEDTPGTWQERLLTEAAELGARLDKLNAFMRTEQYDVLPLFERDMLKVQRDYMAGYADVLARRIQRLDGPAPGDDTQSASA